MIPEARLAQLLHVNLELAEGQFAREYGREPTPSEAMDGCLLLTIMHAMAYGIPREDVFRELGARWAELHAAGAAAASKLHVRGPASEA